MKAVGGVLLGAAGAWARVGDAAASRTLSPAVASNVVSDAFFIMMRLPRWDMYGETALRPRGGDCFVALRAPRNDNIGRHYERSTGGLSSATHYSSAILSASRGLKEFD